MARTNPPTPKFNVAGTYSTTTPESVEAGDFEETGFEVETEPATLEDIVGYAEQYGIGPRESSDYTDWWDSGWSTKDFGTGEKIQYALHVTKLGAPRGERLDDRTFDRLNKILGGKAYRVRDDNPIEGMPGGSVTGCIAQNQDKDDPGAYCAAIADDIEPGWRKKAREENASQLEAYMDRPVLRIDHGPVGTPKSSFYMGTGFPRGTTLAEALRKTYSDGTPEIPPNSKIYSVFFGNEELTYELKNLRYVWRPKKKRKKARKKNPTTSASDIVRRLNF